MIGSLLIEALCSSINVLFLIVQVSEADNSLPLDIHNQVFQLVEKGNEAFKESHRFEEVKSINLSLELLLILLQLPQAN